MAVDGATLRGERDAHLGKGGEWGHGIRIERGSTIISITNCDAAECWGDGIYLGEGVRRRRLRGELQIRPLPPKRMFDHECKNVLFKRCLFSHTDGTVPRMGVDLEPNNTDELTAEHRI